MNKAFLSLLIHSHQPVGNFDHVIEEAYQKAYLPLVESLLLHPRIRVSLHYSGILLDWLKSHHPEFFKELRTLTSREQVELLGGGFFEPILSIIPDTDKLVQIRKLTEFLHRHFGVRPKGAWVAERVWEPTLPKPLAQAGIEYVVLDDVHFLAAGLNPSELHGTYITEETGSPLRLVPSLQSLRYTIPFREPEQTLRILSAGREMKNPASTLFAVGDDGEKFGIWPGTYDHCYKHGWVERFMRAIEDAEEWLETTTVADFVSSHPPVGSIYLPTASYSEMMEWALPTSTSMEFKACMDETETIPSGERFRRFLRGGVWRNFLSKYPEANQIHKLMLVVSQRYQDACSKIRTGSKASLQLDDACAHLLASQCNDPYWHGIFGGLYAPHLRTAVYRHLIKAESALDELESNQDRAKIRVRRFDMDVDGREEIVVQHPTVGVVMRPADGGTISSLRFKPADLELINSLMRRPERYHDLVRQHVGSQHAPHEGPASIHELVMSKEANLESLLRYDRYLRHAFRTYVFPASKTWHDFEQLRLEESEDLADGMWKLAGRSTAKLNASFRLQRDAKIDASGVKLSALKSLSLKISGNRCDLECRSSLTTNSTEPLALGVELVFNLLAPDAHDRYFLFDQQRHPLKFQGEITSPELALVDEWQGVKIQLQGKPNLQWWVVPIETISQSEAGFERVYQGSAILAVWKVDPSAAHSPCTLRASISQWTPQRTTRRKQ